MKTLIRIFLLIALIGGATVGYLYWRSTKVLAAANELTLYGNTDVRQVELAINGNERIAELFVKEGDSVKKGQLLAKLETMRLELSVERAKAQIETQQQVVARLEAGSRPEELAKARADLQAMKAVENDAKRLQERIASLPYPMQARSKRPMTHSHLISRLSLAHRPCRQRSTWRLRDRDEKISMKRRQCSSDSRSSCLKSNTT